MATDRLWVYNSEEKNLGSPSPQIVKNDIKGWHPPTTSLWSTICEKKFKGSIRPRIMIIYNIKLILTTNKIYHDLLVGKGGIKQAHKAR